jgi:hypothetical protein
MVSGSKVSDTGMEKCCGLMERTMKVFGAWVSLEMELLFGLQEKSTQVRGATICPKERGNLNSYQVQFTTAK